MTNEEVVSWLEMVQRRNTKEIENLLNDTQKYDTFVRINEALDIAIKELKKNIKEEQNEIHI